MRYWRPKEELGSQRESWELVDEAKGRDGGRTMRAEAHLTGSLGGTVQGLVGQAGLTCLMG